MLLKHLYDFILSSFKRKNLLLFVMETSGKLKKEDKPEDVLTGLLRNRNLIHTLYPHQHEGFISACFFSMLTKTEKAELWETGMEQF